MAFIDGENFTICGQKVMEKEGITLVAGEHYEKDRFLWLPGYGVTSLFFRNRKDLRN